MVIPLFADIGVCIKSAVGHADEAAVDDAGPGNGNVVDIDVVAPLGRAQKSDADGLARVGLQAYRFHFPARRAVIAVDGRAKIHP
ncbi:hypothetical protein SDC9_54766 [bioreactor metagenome]|uniref:Uncharacterized protein n=1 Tax=bioreactor metagenome TaxID=1076179 RepID=A0A644X2T1_9ZZZZ